jgi:hypothetical protein
MSTTFGCYAAVDVNTHRDVLSVLSLFPSRAQKLFGEYLRMIEKLKLGLCICAK